MSKNKDDLLRCERFATFVLLMFVGGWLGAYTFTMRGGVFCNAQTANIVLLGMNLGLGEWAKAVYYLIPLTAYIIGIIISEILPRVINRIGKLRWDTCFLLFEAVTIICIGFIPLTTPHQISQVAINFIAAMQFNTFRQAEKMPMATTFCTAHLRQTGSYLVRWIRSGKKEYKGNFLRHLAMLGAFALGCFLSAFFSRFFGGYTIIGAAVVLIILFIDLMYADLTYEKGRLAEIPHGH